MNNKTITNSYTNRLITIAISHHCEKVRWALDWLNIPYIEESHVPLFHRFATHNYGGTSVPVLVTETGAFTDSTDILHYLNTIAPESRHLYPTDPELCQEVEQLEELFDTKLGVNIRR
jgi:glutathione S-transferase